MMHVVVPKRRSPGFGSIHAWNGQFRGYLTLKSEKREGSKEVRRRRFYVYGKTRVEVEQKLGYLVTTKREQDEPRKLLRQGFIYFVAAETVGMVKIGFANDVKKRFKELQVSSPVPLTLLGSMPGSIVEERAIHILFKDRKRIGEWFAMNDQLRAFVLASSQ